MHVEHPVYKRRETFRENGHQKTLIMPATFPLDGQNHKNVLTK